MLLEFLISPFFLSQDLKSRNDYLTLMSPFNRRMLNGASNLAFGSLTLVVLVVAQLLRI